MTQLRFSLYDSLEMKHVSKKDLAKQVSDATGLSRVDIEAVINQTVKAIADNVAEGKCVQLRGLGTLEFRLRAGRLKPNPRNLEEQVEVPTHFAVVFNPTPDLKSRVRTLARENVTATRYTY